MTLKEMLETIVKLWEIPVPQIDTSQNKNTADLPMKNDNTFFITKDGNQYGWIGVYSNSFRDDDGVPEIVGSDSHKSFVANVDAGIWDLPDLMLWHNPLWKFGKATFVAYDEVEPGIVFSIAGGTIDEDKTDVAKAINNAKTGFQMSHAMPTKDTVRDAEDPTVYAKHRTTEVSVLPAAFAANHLTNFNITVEDNMIPKNKRDEIKRSLGVDDEFLDQLETQNAAMALVGKQSRDFKEASSIETEGSEATPEVPAEESTKDPVDVAEQDKGIAENVVDTPEDNSQEDSPVNSVAQDLTEVKTLIGEIVVAMEQLKQQHDTLVGTVGKMNEEVAEVKEKMSEDFYAQTPSFSAQYAARIKSIIGTKEAEVEESETEEDDAPFKGPEETQPKAQYYKYGSVLGDLIAGSKS